MSWKLGDNNKTIGYLLPLISDGKKRLNYFWSNNEKDYPQNQLVNVFSKCEEYIDYNRHLFLLYKYSDHPAFINFINRLKLLECYLENYKPDTKHIMIIFKIPDESLDTLEKFRKGKFSEFREIEKEKILKFLLPPHITENRSILESLYVLKFTNPDNELHAGVLYKQQWKKLKLEESLNKGLPKKHWTLIPNDMELTSIPDDEKETYLNKYKLL